ncbi:MAG: PHP domain-containing protein [Chloroflexota bacterium]|nr:PHP domain-containing protein [Chloroflexota bacterium]
MSTPDGRIRLELHAHTHASPDCALSPTRLIELLQDRGIQALAVTDHNTMAGAFEMARVSPMPIILAEEIKSTAGDIIGLFLEEEIPRDMSPRDTVAAIKDQSGLVLLPHPFDSLRRSALREATDSIREHIDILEVFNGRTLRERDNRTAQDYARDHGLVASVGSDSHLAREVGVSWQLLEPWSGPDEFLDNLRHAELHMELAPAWVHAGSSLHAYTTKFRKRLTTWLTR